MCSFLTQQKLIRKLKAGLKIPENTLLKKSPGGWLVNYFIKPGKDSFLMQGGVWLFIDIECAI